MPTKPVLQNLINHIALVLDESSSMHVHRDALIKVADAQIAYLAQRSKELDQETRVTVYTFGYRENIRCLIYDKDVLRMPSIATLYQPNGMTALIDATMLMLNDLETVPTKYGEHAFLAYILTDGLENASRSRPTDLAYKISRLPDSWTLAAFVPDPVSIHEMKKLGFPAGNIAVWDVNSRVGLDEVAETIKRSTDAFMAGRSSGVKSTKSLFKLPEVSTKDITTKLSSVTKGSWVLHPVPTDSRVDDFVRSVTGKPLAIGEAFYQLTKSEEVQPQKQVAILFNGDLYTGKNARTMLGLPDIKARVRPSDHVDYKVFIQSTAPNRKLIQGTNLLMFR